ncbi:MAG: hypothetical protein O7I93_09940 [Gemmatimonadetes bacterium]|nr:hypothetical protein [Gemmatimonadota bacterium]
MSKTKRPWGVIAGPVIFMVGLGIFAGVNKFGSVRDMVEDWGHRLEHSAETVTMELPIYVPLFVGGDWVGRLETVVVQRDQPGAVDSVRLVVRIRDDSHLARLDDCALRLHVPRGDFGQFTRALRCVRDTDGLVPFGDLEVAEAGLHVPIYVRVDDLPCNESLHMGPCGHIQRELQAEMEQLAAELRAVAEEFRVEAEQMKGRVRGEVRQRLRGIR